MFDRFIRSPTTGITEVFAKVWAILSDELTHAVVILLAVLWITQAIAKWIAAFARRTRAVRAFVRKYNLTRSSTGRPEIYQGVILNHTVQMVLGQTLEIHVITKAPVPDGFSVRVVKMPPRNRSRIWAKSGEMDSDYFDLYVVAKALHPEALAQFLLPHRKRALRQILWLGQVGVERDRLIYRKFGGLTKESTVEQVTKFLIDGAHLLEMEVQSQEKKRRTTYGQA